jgi:alkylated DNA repair dioxygenase AlkB
MNLFKDAAEENLLPHGGVVKYYGRVMSLKEAKEYRDILLNSIEWKNDEAVIFGRHIITKRKVAWYGDVPFSYTYSNITKEALPWTSALSELKKIAEDTSGATFNSCLLNLYHTGRKEWHGTATMKNHWQGMPALHR